MVFSKAVNLPVVTSFGGALGGLQSEVLFTDIECWMSTKTTAVCGIAFGNCSSAFIGIFIKHTLVTRGLTHLGLSSKVD